ncbi:MAG: transposase domain-containing protein [Kiritimatiellales bacterium]
MNVPSLISVAELAALPGMPTARTLRRAATSGKYQVEVVDGHGGQRGKQYRFLTYQLPGEWLVKVSRFYEEKSNTPNGLPVHPSFGIPTQTPAVSGLPVGTKPDLIPVIELKERFDGASLKNQERASTRLKALNQVKHLSDAGLTVSDAVAAVAKEYGFSQQSVWNWRKAVRGYPDSQWLLLLIDDYEGRRNNLRQIPQAYLKLVATFYMSDTQPGFAECLRAANRAARAEEPPVDVPRCSEKTIRRHFDSIYLPEAQCYAREGEKAWEARYWPAMRRDRSMLGALEVLNGDGHKLDYWVRWPDGKEGRAMATFWMDLSSNYFFPPAIEASENMDTIRRSFLHICNTVGVPECVDIDNGMGYAGKDLSGQDSTRRRFKKVKAEAKGIFSLLGIRTIWAEVAHGQSKPIERSFRTLEEILKTFPELRPAYVGNKPDKRPDRTIKAVPIDLLRSCVMEAVVRYNAQEGRRSDGIKANGRSYRTIWEGKLAEAQNAGKPRQLEDWERRYCIMPGRVIRVRKANGGIFSLHGNEYQAHELTAWLGEHIQVRFDPEDLTHVRCYDLDGKFICTPTVRTMTGFRDTSTLREYKRAKTVERKRVKDLADVRKDLAKLESRRGETSDPMDDVRAETSRILRDDREELQRVSKATAQREAKSITYVSAAIKRFRKAGIEVVPGRSKAPKEPHNPWSI